MKILFGKQVVIAVASALILPLGMRAEELGATTGVPMSLTLEEAVEIALADNPTIIVANQQIQLKEVGRKEAWQSLLPSADLSGSVQYTALAAEMKLGGQSFKMGKDDTYTWNGQVQVSLPVFAPTVYATMNLTKTDLENAVEQSRSSKLDLVNQVTKAFYQLLLAKDSYAVLQKSYEQSSRNYELINNMFNLGSASEYDKISAEVQMRSIQPTVISARNAVNLAKIQLKVLMGITSDVDIDVEGKMEDYEGELATDIFMAEQCSLENNTSIRQMKLSENMLQQTLKVQQTGFMPTLALVGSYAFQSLYNENLKIGHYDWGQSSSIVLSLSVPIFRASNFTKMKTTKLQISQLAENRKYTERQLRMQVSAYVDNMNASAEQVSSNKEAVAQARKGYEISRKRYEIGGGTILELNNSEIALVSAELTYSQSIYDYLAAKADLDKVLGNDELILKNDK